MNNNKQKIMSKEAIEKARQPDGNLVLKSEPGLIINMHHIDNNTPKNFIKEGDHLVIEYLDKKATIPGVTRVFLLTVVFPFLISSPFFRI